MSTPSLDTLIARLLRPLWPQSLRPLTWMPRTPLVRLAVLNPVRSLSCAKNVSTLCSSSCSLKGRD